MFSAMFFLLQAGAEPPYLPVGTDVSAKYRGAFCEAKVKKIVKSVKCKVSPYFQFQFSLGYCRVNRNKLFIY